MFLGVNNLHIAINVLQSDFCFEHVCQCDTEGWTSKVDINLYLICCLELSESFIMCYYVGVGPAITEVHRVREVKKLIFCVSLCL